MKLVIEGTITRSHGERKKTSGEKSWIYKDPGPHFHDPHITNGYLPMNEEESKLNVKPLVERCLNLRYL